MGLFDFFSTDVAVDLGTANTLFWIKGNIVLNEPTIVAYNNDKEILDIGNGARAMLGKAHKDIKIIRPLRDGAIADFDIAEGMLKAFIRAVSKNKPVRRIVVCVPSGLTEVEKRAVRDSCEHAGAKEVHLIAEPMAAAIGIGLDVHGPIGNMIVDIGGGTTEIAIIALSGIVENESIRIAGDELTNAIVAYFKKNYSMSIGDITAEGIKKEVGSAVPLEEEIEIEVKGRNMTTGLPDRKIVNSVDIREALSDSVDAIVNGVLNILDRTPPDLAADIYERGIMLSGGGALLKGLDERLRAATKLPVMVADDPLTAVIRGTGIVLDNLSDYSRVLLKSSKY